MQSLDPESRRSIVGGTPSKRSETLPMRSALFSESKGLGTRAKSRPSLNNAFAKPSTQEAEFSPPLSVNKTRQPVSNYSSSLTSPSSTVSKSSSIVSANSDQLPQHPESQIRQASKSSSALRESIAKAKAARKASRQSSVGPGGLDSWDNLNAQDPFNQAPKDSNRGLLLKRIEAARVSGSLNVAAMGLKVIPDEVMTMYDYDPNNNSEWYESVDLVKFIAADNELEQIPDIAFPDIDPQDYGLEDDCKGNQFGGLEILDLRGNMLRSLPIGLRRLQRLHSLNLSNNQLGMDDIDVVMEIESLLDLKLASNNLKGDMVADLGRLRNLEVLDLRGNHLRALPETLSDLSSLKTLNVADNELKTLPFETLSSLPLMELNAARNKLQGSLIGQPVHHFRTLQTLNVAYNSLDKLTEADSFDFPNLQTLSINANRLKALPCVSTWRSLLRISAEDNNIAALPEGFLELDNLKHVDLTANDLTKLDERIGLMENLATFRIANNPLRERKFLTMDTDNLKEDLRNRCVPPAVETTEDFGAEDDRENRIRDDGDEDEEEGSVATDFTLAPESPSHLNRWKVKSGGVLDQSATEMTELDVEELKPLLSTHDIRCLYIQRNNLQSFPVSALNLIATTLVDLDLSKNPLKTTDLFSDLIKLPQLQNLTVTASGLTSLDPLFANCFAPSLKFLDVSANRLTGALPPARHTYPKLTTFLVADNQITSLRFDAVEGLQVLDVSNNNIDYLPPKIGLLGAEGSGPKLAGGPGLKRFEVTGNSFRVPRWQIVGKGTEAVLEWLKGRIPADELEGGDIVE
jgi:Leucine-rich repeat (LRR) protein